MIFPTTAEARAKGQRGGVKRAIYRISGEFVGLREIAERLGVSIGAASARMRKLRGASGAISWERLRGHP